MDRDWRAVELAVKKKTPQKRGVFIQQRLLITTIAQI
nr:MAG TPA: hypothetical protein [Caudoviricetes sp.]